MGLRYIIMGCFDQVWSYQDCESTQRLHNYRRSVFTRWKFVKLKRQKGQIHFTPRTLDFHPCIRTLKSRQSDATHAHTEVFTPHNGMYAQTSLAQSVRDYIWSTCVSRLAQLQPRHN